MATNNLKAILEKEGINLDKISKRSGIKAATIKRVCNQRRTVAPKTEVKILKGLSRLTENTYSVNDIFPNRVLKNPELYSDFFPQTSDSVTPESVETPSASEEVIPTETPSDEVTSTPEAAVATEEVTPSEDENPTA